AIFPGRVAHHRPPAAQPWHCDRVPMGALCQRACNAWQSTYVLLENRIVLVRGQFTKARVLVTLTPGLYGDAWIGNDIALPVSSHTPAGADDAPPRARIVAHHL